MQLQLNQSDVIFTEAPHGYWLNGKRLCGITGLIHYITGLGSYPQASDYVKNYCIPRAGEYGSSVHAAIEHYDKTCERKTSFRNTFDGGVWEVHQELDNYIKQRGNYIPIANEYTVTDGYYASNIDNIWQDPHTSKIILVDTKTNNLQYYPGGVDALKEYLSWQLSIYAELFELQNPELKVSRLACNWLRKGESQFWEIDRKPSHLVRLMLTTPYEYISGEFRYISTLDIIVKF